MRYIQNYNQYQQIDEGMKNWIATFLLLANMGLAPAHVVAGSKEDKKEFVETLDVDKREGALFVDYLNKLGKVTDLESTWSKFKQDNNLKSDYQDIEKYVNRDGKVYRFDKKYITHDYANVDINNFIPTNWMTDMGDIIEDSREPEINNWISDYEKLTSVEIGIITVNNLGEYPDVDGYTNEQFRRLGVGKAKANNGLLMVFSKEDRKWRIEVGYGLEGLLTDAQAGQIGRNVIVPHFKEGDYYGGIMAALEAIKGELGTEAIESKKKWIEEKQAKEKAEMAESFQNFIDVVLGILVIGLLGYLVYYLTNRARLKREEREKMMRRIDSLLKQIDDIKSKFPSQPKISASTQLGDIHSLVKKVIEESKIQPANQKFDDESRKNLEIVLGKLRSSTDAYYSREKSVGSTLSDILALGGVVLMTKSMIDKATDAAQKIQELGYQAKPIDQSLFNQLEQNVNQIQSLAKTDVDSALAQYSKIKSDVEALQTKSSRVIGTLSDIKSAMSRVENWEKEVERKYQEFKDLASKEEKEAAKEEIKDLKNKIESSKDYILLSSEIDKVLSELDKPIERDRRRKREEEEKKRREREEEERRKRRKREEEEEEDRRRRNSYSSYSSSSYDSGSSSSSFGGFGGGDSGGGGASGSW